MDVVYIKDSIHFVAWHGNNPNISASYSFGNMVDSPDENSYFETISHEKKKQMEIW